MNPFPMVWADIRALRWTALAIIALVALAVAVGVAIGAQERALRRSSAAAAEDFDLLIGAPGSQTQLLMSAVYLQPDAVPLMDGRLLNTLAQDERVAGVAPIAFGDVSKGYVIVGTTAAFAGRWGRLAPSQGRLFAREGEAVLGADVSYGLGDSIAPSHGVLGASARPGVAHEDEAGHRHAGHDYVAVGRLPRLGSPWDRAILVPVESVWEIHGLANGHAADDGRIGPPFDGPRIPGVPALVVKPRGVAGAYALRAQYRQGGTMAFFPAEVLVTLYRALGDVRSVLVAASFLNALLILAAVLLLLIAVAGLRRRRYAILRALGAPRGYVLLVVWLGMAGLIGAGCVAGLLAGAVLTTMLSGVIAGQTGLRLVFAIESQEIAFVAALLLIGSAITLVPALMSYRAPAVAGLRD
ncbi:FtsX-like permease family protein [Bosea psychrotolerans]|uniref:Putative ABC transport system permease protein n=1 Tax=Bosea psychrotolerans TaxID=1871628 RepID=A0A2S4LSF0_9HYPH|nr:ABC transporter permease [Bosea psychrotolerans]POR45354.1 putative ABC transport system permease protein [Bosea psychrotolerans]